MAHECPECGQMCYCHGDIDDSVVETRAYSALHCTCCDDAECDDEDDGCDNPCDDCGLHGPCCRTDTPTADEDPPL